MNRRISAYLDELGTALRGLDRAVVQDALADAEDHLTEALRAETASSPGIPEEEAFARVVERFGTPVEIASRCTEIERLTSPGIGAAPGGGRSGLLRFVGIVADPKAWGAMLYLLLSVATGCIYFTWAVTGLYVSLGLLILIIGLPVAWLFLLSFRGVSLVEGRIVEALLGVRMPRRAVYPRNAGGWWAGFRRILATRSTWTGLLYMILMLPLGTLYFSVFVTLLATGLSFAAAPVLQAVLDEPFIEPDFWIPVWGYPVAVLAGFLFIVATLHLGRLTGRLHGRIARAMLVS